MARQDISINPEYGEINMANNITNKTLYAFKLLEAVEGMDNDAFCYGEISVPQNFESSYNKDAGIFVAIPYEAKFKKLKVRFALDETHGIQEYMINRTNNKQWFQAYQKTDSGDSPIYLSELIRINPNFIYNLVIENGAIYMYSGYEMDLQILPALEQNKALLLKSFTWNIWQHPTTGVGLIDYINSDLENSDLASKLKQEFESDGMTIVNAGVDQELNRIYLNITEKDG